VVRVVRPVSRRGFLALSGGAALAGALSACSSPIVTSLDGAQPAEGDVIFWNLFTGGDGANMKLMEDGFATANPAITDSASTFSWGNPYYTKLSLAIASGRPPTVGISHVSRLIGLAEAGLVQPVNTAYVESFGITRDKFTPRAWDKATINGTTWAIPLDTHPFVLYYNIKLAKKAGLLNAAGDNLEPTVTGQASFLAAVTELQKAAGPGGAGAVMSIIGDPVTCWRFFNVIYPGLTEVPIVSENGTKVTVDREALLETFAFMRKLTAAGLSVGTGTAASTLFGGGKAGFLFDGEWDIPTYQPLADPLPNLYPELYPKGSVWFNVIPYPALVGKTPVSYADSHTFVLPRNAARSHDALVFVKGLLDLSYIWAHGGHIPAYLPVQTGQIPANPALKFPNLSPQKNYRDAAYNAVYDPSAWYTGAGSDFQNSVGQAILNVLLGASPQSGADQMVSALKTYSSERPPVATSIGGSA
jgi:multiple sugar transport system substrate-binding protein